MVEDIANIRREYGDLTLNEEEVLASPFLQFEVWLEKALNDEREDPTAMVLSTVDANGFPNARVVLLKEIKNNAFIFYTHYDSVKGQEIKENPRAALTFYWPKQARQVRVRGTVSLISETASDIYFDSRPLMSKLSALASHQSQPLANRALLEEQYQQLVQAYENKQPLRPKSWGGYAVEPLAFEFWQGRNNRLHDRICYVNEAGIWIKSRLFP